MAKGQTRPPRPQACRESSGPPQVGTASRTCGRRLPTSGQETTDAKFANWETRRIRGLAPLAACRLGYRTLLSSLVSCRQFCRLPPGRRGGGFLNVSGAAIGEADIGFRPIKLLWHPVLSSVTQKVSCRCPHVRVEVAATASPNSQSQLETASHSEGRQAGEIGCRSQMWATTWCSCLLWRQSRTSALLGLPGIPSPRKPWRQREQR